MKIHPTVASVVGQTSDMRWGQVLQTPHAYGVIEVFTPDNIARQKGVEILTKLTRQLSDPPVSLSALELIADDVVTSDVVSLILFVPVGTVLYLVCRGGGQVCLKRGNKLAVLMEQAGALSGQVQQDDTVIAASAGFTKTLSRDDILGVFDHLSPQEVAEKLTILLHERQGGEGGAAFIYHAQAVSETESIAPTVEEVVREAPKPPATSLRSFVRGAKPLLRSVTSPRQRVLLRRTWSTYRARLGAMSPKKIITAIVIGLFVISIIFGITHRSTSFSSKKTQDVLAAAQHAFDEGLALADLNPIKGRERLTQAKELLAPIVSKKSRTSDAQKAKELYDLVSESLTRAMRITQVKPELFFDVALLKSGAFANEMSLFEDSLGMLDVAGKTVYTVDVPTKRGAIVGGGEALSGALHIASYADKIYVQTPKGISAIRLLDQKTTSNIIPAAPEWTRITGMVAFGGNIYLLDIGKNRIWKYVATEKGFSELREYLNPDFFPDISASTNMIIDGSVWLGSTNGSLSRFSGGKENSITPQGVEPKFGKNLQVFTTDESKNVYVMDSDNSRVVTLDKEGAYMAQFVWGSSFAPTGFVVSEKTKRILLLSSGKIYTIGLE